MHVPQRLLALPCGIGRFARCANRGYNGCARACCDDWRVIASVVTLLGIAIVATAAASASCGCFLHP